MKREQVANWLDSKGKVEKKRDHDGNWDSLTFETMIGMMGQFINFVGKAEVRCSVTPEMVIMTIRNHCGEKVILTFCFDGCNEDKFENETASLVFL